MRLPTLIALLLLPLAVPAVLAETPESANVDWKPYMDRMNVMVKRHWYPPKATTSSRVVVKFELDASGQVHKIRIAHSSGDAVRDAQAMEAIKTTAPFEALPEKGPQRIEVEFNFDFDPKLGPKPKATYKPAAENKQPQVK